MRLPKLTHILGSHVNQKAIKANLMRKRKKREVLRISHCKASFSSSYFVSGETLTLFVISLLNKINKIWWVPLNNLSLSFYYMGGNSQKTGKVGFSATRARAEKKKSLPVLVGVTASIVDIGLSFMIEMIQGGPTMADYTREARLV